MTINTLTPEIAMKRVSVRFDVEVPDDMSFEKAEEWIAFETKYSSQMTADHPQMNKDMEPIRGSLYVTQR